ncbi:MAG: DUF1189 family protein, partial [Elusimicrobia bacterium]|nr:DUF1189 family protein [Elusimicrobiota bacterium]
MIKDIARSIGDFSFYQEAVRKPVWATVAYLVLLGAFFSLAVTAALYVNVRPRILDAAEWAGAHIPKLTLSEGRLSSDAAAPTEVRNPAMPEFGLMVDTGRKEPVTPEEMTQKKLVVYLTGDSAYVLTQDRLETYELSKTKGEKPLVMDADFYRQTASVLLKVLYPIGFLTAWLTFIVWKHVAALVYSLIALLINAVVEGGHEFPSLYRMAVYAQTPVVVLQTAALFWPRPVPLFSLLALLVVSAYLWQGIRHAAP